MSNQLQENLNLILEEKNTKLLPKNLKAGITCLGVTGELESELDTSDATATANDIVANKTAYVNGEKVVGTIWDGRGTEASPNRVSLSAASATPAYYDTPNGQGGMMEFDIIPDGSSVVDQTTAIVVNATGYTIADVVGLTENKIAAGQTILGITGTYKPVALSNVVPDSALVLMHLDGDNINAITGDTVNMPKISVYQDPKFGVKSARATNMYVENFTGIPTYTELVNAAAELTVSFWGYLQNTTGKLIFSAKQSTYNNNAFTIQQSNTTALNVNGTIVEIGSHLRNQWHHYGIMISGGYLTVYFDGTKIYNGQLSGSGTIPLRLKFGESDTAVLRVDEVLVCNEAIYSGDFIPLEEPYILPPVDTFDATATENDIVAGKTAYVKGEKIEGMISEIASGGLFTLDSENIEDRGDVPEMVVAECAMIKPTILQSNSKVEILMNYANLANAINLTSDKIVSGNTILGIEGTGGGSGESTGDPIVVTSNYSWINYVLFKSNLQMTDVVKSGDGISSMSIGLTSNLKVYSGALSLTDGPDPNDSNDYTEVFVTIDGVDIYYAIRDLGGGDVFYYYHWVQGDNVHVYVLSRTEWTEQDAITFYNSIIIKLK